MMSELHPISPYTTWLSHSTQVWAFWLLLVIAVALAVYLTKLGAPVDARLPADTLDLEAPWSSARAKLALNMLGEDGIAAARHQTYVDFAFLIAYPLALSLGCGLSEGLSGKHALMGMLMAWAVLLALPLDATENFCMLSMLNGNAAAPWPQVATVCAALKFTLAAGAFLFLAVGGMEQLALRR